MATLNSTNLSSFESRLGNCEICAIKQAKYTCPRCEVKTCCLSCVEIHKNELECDGIRDRTVYKSLKKFSNIDLLSDYRFLEDISRSVNKYKKDTSKKWTRFQKELPIHLYKLKNAAFVRGTRLLFLPQNFSKHKENTTYYDWKTKELFWRVEWIFFGLNGEIKFVNERVSDTEKLTSKIAEYLSPNSFNEDLERYYSADINSIVLLMKAEKMPNKFYELDVCSSLKKNLRRKTVIEFPTIFVILKYDKYGYDLIDSDEDILTNYENIKSSNLE